MSTGLKRLTDAAGGAAGSGSTGAGAAGGAAGVGIIRYYNAISDGIKSTYTAADWIETGFTYKTGVHAIEIWFDGVYQYNVLTEINSTTISLNAVPLAGVAILCKTVSSYTTSGDKITEYRFIGDGIKTAFTAADMNVAGFAYTPNNRELLVDLGSAMQNSSDYIETNANTITFTVAPPNGVVGVIRVIGAVQLADAVLLSQKDVAGGYTSFSRAKRYSFGA